MGIAGAVTALVAAVAALAISPALLATWGTKLARPSAVRSTQRWTRFARRVMRRPVAVAVITTAAMVTIASLSLGTHWTPVDSQVIPKSQSSRTVADAVVDQFPEADETPIIVAAKTSGGNRTVVVSLAGKIRRTAGVTRVSAPRYLGRDTWLINAVPAGDPTGDSAQRIVTEIRRLNVSFPIHVGGQAADFVDQQKAIADRLPLAIGLLALLTFTVLWLMTDSLVLPLKALVMNALTVGAALAPLNLVYGHGRLTGVLDYTSNGGVEPVDFLVAAALVFALSTDYGVFLLGRISEAHRAGAEVREAVTIGVGHTGRVLTAAAILLAVAIGAFATSEISFIQQIGIATAFGVLIDALVVRSLLVPSLIALLGSANWWSPSPLHSLHQRVVPRGAHSRSSPAPAVRPGA
jgi:RND superfamily putative drug exporter